MNIHMSRERVLEQGHTESQASLPSTPPLVSNCATLEKGDLKYAR